MQIYIILLLVTFAFLVLMTPGYVLFVYVMLVDYRRTPQSFSGYIFIHSFSQKTFYTNYGINFFLYVISGKKFRSDLVWLFRKKSAPSSDQPSNASNTIMTVAANWLGNSSMVSVIGNLLYAAFRGQLIIIIFVVAPRNNKHHSGNGRHSNLMTSYFGLLVTYAVDFLAWVAPYLHVSSTCVMDSSDSHLVNLRLFSYWDLF